LYRNVPSGVNDELRDKSLVYFEPKVEKFKLENFAPFVNGNNIHDIFKELSDAMYHVERNGNAKIILTDLSIKLV
jgi:DNA polymerase-3 subunit delta'